MDEQQQQQQHPAKELRANVSHHVVAPGVSGTRHLRAAGSLLTGELLSRIETPRVTLGE